MSGHVSAGRLNGIHAEPGTLLGPKVVTRELVVVTGSDDRGVTVGYARTQDVAASGAAVLARGPRSLTEYAAAVGAQRETRAQLAWLFGGDPR